MEIEKRTLTPAADFSGELAFYLASFDKARDRLRKTAADLTAQELSERAFPGAHQIGNLILHLGESEAYWIWQTIGGRDLTDEEKSFVHFMDSTERDFAEKNYGAAECLERIDEITRRSRRILAGLTDADLDRFFGCERADGQRVEVTLRWVLTDLIDHEAVHRGQISMLKRFLRETNQ